MDLNDDLHKRAKELGIPATQEEKLRTRINHLRQEVESLKLALSRAVEMTGAAANVFTDAVTGLYWHPEYKILFIKTISGPKRFLRVHMDRLGENELEVEWGWTNYEAQTLWEYKDQ